MNKARATILAIGTELTHGQILNSNAQTLSKKLMELGFKIHLHLTCPDQMQLMKKSLMLALEEGDLVLITGGLGPTSDDLTREFLCETLDLELELSPQAQRRMEKKLLDRKIKLTSGHLKQCQFPKGAFLLENPVGTADGFVIESTQKEKTIVALPGPPKELLAIWDNSLKAFLEQKFPSLEADEVLSWDTLGLPESHIAELIEKNIKNLSPCQAGYRVHLPFVEFKLIYPRKKCSEALAVAKKVEEVLAPFTVLRNGEDSLEILLSVLQKSAAKRLRIYDGLESSYLTDRLARSKFFAALKAAHIQCAYTQMQSEAQLEGTIELGIRKLPPTESSSWAEAWVKIDKIGNAWAKKQAWPSAYSAPALADRSSMYFYEKAILFWGTALQQMT